MEVKDLKTGEVFTDEAECFVNASGLLSTPKRTSSISRTASYADQFSVPDVENLEAFKGQVLHTAEWDDSIDLNGKTVALVGAGSSSLQVLPMIQPKAKHVDQYIRSSTWVSLKYTGIEKASEWTNPGHSLVWQQHQSRVLWVQQVLHRPCTDIAFL